jgi:hypothetical protein
MKSRCELKEDEEEEEVDQVTYNPTALLVLLLTVIPAFIRALRIQSSFLLGQSLIQCGETCCCTSHITPATITAFRFRCEMFAAASLRIQSFASSCRGF